MRRCTRRGRIWQGREPWRRSGRPRWPLFGPSSNKTARPSRERELGRARQKRAKEAEGLRTSLADRVVALATTEEQLQQEQVARQQAEAQLQQERTALAEARAALERERLAREEAQGQLQQEHAALEGARATLKQRDDEVSRLNG
jgi:chromosome segregation ATPase